MDIESLRDYCQEQIEKHPGLKSQITETYSLAVEEIDEGGSESNECELAQGTIEEYIEDMV